MVLLEVAMYSFPISTVNVPCQYVSYFHQIFAPGQIHAYVCESIADVAALSDTITYEYLVLKLKHRPSLLFDTPQLAYPDFDDLKHFGRNLYRAGRNIGIAITYLLIGVALPLVIGLLALFANEEGPHCLECINISGKFYPKYSLWSALCLSGVGVILLLVGIRSALLRLWSGSTNRYHIIRAG